MNAREIVPAAFVLDRLDFLPADYADVVEAWDRLGPAWQEYVRTIKRQRQRHRLGQRRLVSGP